jgi:hypothetical protein
MRVPLSRADARRAAMACRSLAHILRRDAESQKYPTVAAPKLSEVAHLERLAEAFEHHAANLPQGLTKVLSMSRR